MACSGGMLPCTGGLEFTKGVKMLENVIKKCDTKVQWGHLLVSVHVVPLAPLTSMH